MLQVRCMFGCAVRAWHGAGSESEMECLLRPRLRTQMAWHRQRNPEPPAKSLERACSACPHGCNPARAATPNTPGMYKRNAALHAQPVLLNVKNDMKGTLESRAGVMSNACGLVRIVHPPSA